MQVDTLLPCIGYMKRQFRRWNMFLESKDGNVDSEVGRSSRQDSIHLQHSGSHKQHNTSKILHRSELREDMDYRKKLQIEYYSSTFLLDNLDMCWSPPWKTFLSEIRAHLFN